MAVHNTPDNIGNTTLAFSTQSKDRTNSTDINMIIVDAVTFAIIPVLIRLEKKRGVFCVWSHELTTAL